MRIEALTESHWAVAGDRGGRNLPQEVVEKMRQTAQ